MFFIEQTKGESSTITMNRLKGTKESADHFQLLKKIGPVIFLYFQKNNSTVDDRI